MACAGGLDDGWQGSVDAVFRYRASERSTTVYEVRPRSMSLAAGLRPGDRVVSIDGLDVDRLDAAGVQSALRGPVGSRARLVVLRAGIRLEFEIERRPLRDQAD